MTWDELTVWASKTTHTLLNHRAAEVEFLRRNVLFQKEASDAAKHTAEFTRHNAKYMLLSTIALAVSAILQVFALWLSLIIHIDGK